MDERKYKGKQCRNNIWTEAVAVSHLFCNVSTSFSWILWLWQIAVSWVLRDYAYTRSLFFHVWTANQTLVMGVTTCHAVRHNFSIQTIFFVHTLQITENQHYQAARSSTKSVSFGSVWFEWVRRVLGTLFPVTSAGEKCKGSVRHGRRHDYLLFVSCIVYRSASAFIKIKNQNYKHFPH
jgi:hypothetical protein